MNSSNDPEINPYSPLTAASASPVPEQENVATPLWGYLFFIACMSIMAATRGGAIWGAVGGGVGAICLTVSKNQQLAAPVRIAICTVNTASLWSGIWVLPASQTR